MATPPKVSPLPPPIREPLPRASTTLSLRLPRFQRIAIVLCLSSVSVVRWRERLQCSRHLFNGGVFADHPLCVLLIQADDLIGIAYIAVFHTR